MPYLGYEPSKVAVTVGQGVIDATHIQDASITTADLGNDSVTPIKVDDDGTGFQMGSLGLGTAVSGSHKLTVGGTATFSGNITGNLVGNVTGNTSGTAATVTGATQSAITSLGTLTSLTAGTTTITGLTHLKGSAWNSILRLGDTSRSEQLTHMNNGSVNFSIYTSNGTKGVMTANHDGSAMTLGADYGSGTLTVTPPTTFGGWVYVNNRVMASTAGGNEDIRVGSHDGNEMLHLLGNGTARIDTAGTTALTIDSSQQVTFASNLLTLTHGSLDTRLKIEATASNRAGILQLLGGSSDKVAIDFGQSGGTGDLGRIRYDISSTTMNFINGDHGTPELILSTSSATFAGLVEIDGAYLQIDNGGLRIDRHSNPPYILMQYDGTGVAQLRGVSGGGLTITNGGAGTTWQSFDSSGNITFKNNIVLYPGWSTTNIAFGSAVTGHTANNTGARIEVPLHATGGAAHGSFKFYTNSGDTQNHSLTLEESGQAHFLSNVGIKTAPGGYSLKISGTTYGDGTGQFANALMGEVTIGGTNYAMIGSNSSSRGIALCRDGSASFVGIVIEGNGYIKAPYVYTGNTSSAANVHVTSDGFLYRSTSAKKYKTNIKNYNTGLDMINQMQPISYKANKKTTRDNNDKTHAGLLADDIHDLGLTEFVEYNDDGEVENIYYERLVTVCINAIKELSTKVTALEAK